MKFLVDVLEIPECASGEFKDALLTFNVAMRMTANISKNYFKNLLSVEYSILTDIQKNQYDVTSRFIRAVRMLDLVNVELCRSALLRASTNLPKIPYLGDVDEVKSCIAMKEITLASNLTVIAKVEMLEGVRYEVKNGIWKVVKKCWG